MLVLPDPMVGVLLGAEQLEAGAHPSRTVSPSAGSLQPTESTANRCHVIARSLLATMQHATDRNDSVVS